MGVKIRNIGVAVLLFSCVIGRMGYDNIERFFLFFSCLLLCVGYVTDWVSHKEYDYNTILQRFFISGAFLLWFLFAISSKFTDKTHIGIIIVEAITLLLAFGFWGNSFIPYIRKKISDLKFKFDIRKTVIIGIVLFLCSFQIWRHPVYDEITYYVYASTLRNWDFTLKDSFLTLCDHLSIGVNIAIFPGLALFENVATGVKVCLVVFTVIASFAVISTVDFFTEKKWASLVVLLFPAFIGTQALNCDYLGWTFFVIMYACYLRDKDDFMLLFATLFCFSKEPNVIAYFLFVIGMTFTHVVIEHKKLDIRKTISLLAPLFAWFIIYVAAYFNKTRLAVWGQVRSDSGEISTTYYSGGVGADFLHMHAVLIEGLLLNGIWVLTLAIVVIIICKKVRHEEFNRARILKIVPLFCAAVGCLGFGCIYRTYANYRYVLVANYATIIIALYLLEDFSFTRKILNKLVVGLSVIFFAEQFFLIDPLTVYTAYMKNPIMVLKPALGHVYDYSLTHEKTAFIQSNLTLNQNFYNRGILIERILQQVDYDEHTMLCICGVEEYDPALELFGSYGADEFYYNPKTKRCDSVLWDGADGLQVNYGTIHEDGSLERYCGHTVEDGWYDRFVLIETPYGDDYTLEDAVQATGYSCRLIKEVSCLTWNATVYELEVPKDEMDRLVLID